MRTIKCDFKVQDIEKDPDLYKILQQGGQCTKLWALYGCCHLNNQYFKPICLTLKEDPIINVSHLRHYVENIQGTFFGGFKESAEFSFYNWEYFSPAIRRKIKLEFEKGSSIKSITIK